MAVLVAADTMETAICSLVSESEPACIARVAEGEQFARAHAVPFVHSSEITQMFDRRLVLQDADAL